MKKNRSRKHEWANSFITFLKKMINTLLGRDSNVKIDIKLPLVAIVVNVFHEKLILDEEDYLLPKSICQTFVKGIQL